MQLKSVKSNVLHDEEGGRTLNFDLCDHKDEHCKVFRDFLKTDASNVFVRGDGIRYIGQSDRGRASPSSCRER